MVICPYYIAHSTDIRMIQERHNRSFSCGSNLFRTIRSFGVATIAVLFGRLPRNNFDSDLRVKKTNELLNLDI